MCIWISVFISMTSTLLARSIKKGKESEEKLALTTQRVAQAPHPGPLQVLSDMRVG